MVVFVNNLLSLCSVELKEYQLLGLNYLVLLHSQDLNAILADEMVSQSLSVYCPMHNVVEVLQPVLVRGNQNVLSRL